MINFKLTGNHIELVRLLKAAKLVGSGGEAKMAVVDGLVKLNGRNEKRKRVKIRKGDVVLFKEEEIRVE